jgi:hypothetical protein
VIHGELVKIVDVVFLFSGHVLSVSLFAIFSRLVSISVREPVSG